MRVYIPQAAEHQGIFGATYEIADTCPVCGGKRGEVFKGLSYDGSRRLEVDCWKNPCGHIDKYSAVRAEGKRIA